MPDTQVRALDGTPSLWLGSSGEAPVLRVWGVNQWMGELSALKKKKKLMNKQRLLKINKPSGKSASVTGKMDCSSNPCYKV